MCGRLFVCVDNYNPQSAYICLVCNRNEVYNFRHDMSRWFGCYHIIFMLSCKCLSYPFCPSSNKIKLKSEMTRFIYGIYIYIFKSRDNYTSQLYYYSMDNSIKQYFLFIYFTGPLSEVQTAVSLEVNLPCDLIPASAMLMQDKVTLVIWYREGNDKPIYT